MADAGKPIAKPQAKAAEPLALWRPFQSLRQEIDRLFDDFDGSAFPRAFHALRAHAGPAVDVAETDQAYEITAELPGMAEKDIHVEVVNGDLRIRGESAEEREEKRKDYVLSERRRGAFERRLRIPDGVDVEKIEAHFKNGLLAVTLPKTAAAQKPVKEIAVKTA